MDINKCLSQEEKKETRKSFEAIFKKYRFCKYLVEASESESESEDISEYKQFCSRIEEAVNKLSPIEKNIITERYMKDDYITDTEVYKNVIYMSAPKYDKVRHAAFFKLDTIVRIEQVIKRK